MSPSSRQAWLTLLAVPLIWAVAALVGNVAAATLGIPAGHPAPLWLSAVLVALVGVLYVLAYEFAIRRGRRAVDDGDPHGLWPARVVLVVGVLTIVQFVAFTFLA